MILIDTALQKRVDENRPILVGLVGAGFMARGIAVQILQSSPGIRLVAVANRTVEKAEKIYQDAGASKVQRVSNAVELSKAIEQKQYAVTEDPMLLCTNEQIEVIVEVTGTVEYAAHVVLTAMDHGKHVIMMNAELDGTLGPILQTYAQKAGVVLTNADGDQPGVIMNLYRFVKGIGVKPVLCGNIKGLHDPYRNPTTQESFAKQWGQNPSMVTSFADGSKISFEQTVVANATGMRVAKRGMHGPTVATGTPITESVNWYPAEDLLNGPGIVDYVVGAAPNPGVFVLGTHDNPIQQHYLNLYKLGTGPFYCFYTPYHLCHFEVPNTIARVALFHDAALAAKGAPQVEVVATAKIELKAGETLDGIGKYMTYGLCENADIARKENLIPIGLSEGCRLKNDIPKDQVITFDDVELPSGRLCDQLWKEQIKKFNLD